MGLSSVKRYAKVAREGRSLRPKKSPGRRPKADERARMLLEADLQERPAATLSERCDYLRNVAGIGASESSVSRLLHRMGWSRKKDRWERANATSSWAAWRTLVAGEIVAERLVFVDEMGSNTSLAALYAWVAARGSCALLGAAQPRQEHHSLGKHDE